MSKSLKPAQSLQLLDTEDGSQTVFNTELGSTYHSRHGALTESQHIFILQGFKKFLETKVMEVTILEMGFGTGLNALLTALQAREKGVKVNYHALELYPLPEDVWSKYKLPKSLHSKRELFDQLHQVSWNEPQQIDENFQLTKHAISLLDFAPKEKYDLVYFDAFEPEAQPELWTQEVFGNIFDNMRPGGILTTYCCKGDVRRAMLRSGFEVEKIPGPPGKREILRATCPLQ